ncbi:MAG: hypothetical protein QM308_07020 [Bacillota bacterium]|nr:hypothetical protein [Bacillota bacterium]
MNEGLTILISSVISLFVAIITALITSRLTIKQEVKKAIYAKRETAYIELFDLLFTLKDNPYLVYNNSKFLKPLSDLRTRLKLFASQDVLDVFNPFFDQLRNTASSYWKLFSGEEYEMNKSSRIEHGNETDLDFEREKESYQEDHLLEACYVNNTIKQLVLLMRKDMGTK